MIKYATVSEAYSGRPEDVESYLSELKKDLCIGQKFFPSYVSLGDQQVYAIMKNLKRKNHDSFELLFPVPGDWHFSKRCYKF